MNRTLADVIVDGLYIYDGDVNDCRVAFIICADAHSNRWRVNDRFEALPFPGCLPDSLESILQPLACQHKAIPMSQRFTMIKYTISEFKKNLLSRLLQ